MLSRSVASALVLLLIRADYVQLTMWENMDGTCSGTVLANTSGTCCCQAVVDPLPPHDTYLVNVTCHSKRNATIDLFIGHCAGVPWASTTTMLPAGCAPFHPFDDDTGGTGMIGEQTCMPGTPLPSAPVGSAEEIWTGGYGAALREAVEAARSR